MNSRSKFKVREGFVVSDIITIFTRESVMVKCLRSIRAYSTAVVLFLVMIYIMRFMRQCVLLKYFIAVVIFFIICGFLIKKCVEVKCLNIKNKKDNKSIKIVYIIRIIKDIIYNENLVKEEDFKLFKKILKVNGIDNNKSIEELRERYASKKRKEIDITMFFNVIVPQYFLVIMFDVINIYLSMNIGIELNEKLIDMTHILYYIILIIIIVFCLYLCFMIKRISSPNDYVINQIEKMLFEIHIGNLRSKFIQKEINSIKSETKKFYSNAVAKKKIADARKKR